MIKNLGGGTFRNASQLHSPLRVPPNIATDEKVQISRTVEMFDGTEVPCPNTKYKRLPHVDVAGYYQFITFRTYDSMDEFLKKLYARDIDNSKKQLEIDEYLDVSKNGSYFYADILLKMSEFLKSKDGVLYELIAFVIMPNHIHLLIKPLEELAMVMKKIKGASSKMINDMMLRSGRFWHSDYYDKGIRDERHFNMVYNYVKNNPLVLREGSEMPDRFYGVYE